MKFCVTSVPISRGTINPLKCMDYRWRSVHTCVRTTLGCAITIPHLMQTWPAHPATFKPCPCGNICISDVPGSPLNFPPALQNTMTTSHITSTRETHNDILQSHISQHTPYRTKRSTFTKYTDLQLLSDGQTMAPIPLSQHSPSHSAHPKLTGPLLSSPVPANIFSMPNPPTNTQHFPPVYTQLKHSQFRSTPQGSPPRGSGKYDSAFVVNWLGLASGGGRMSAISC